MKKKCKTIWKSHQTVELLFISKGPNSRGFFIPSIQIFRIFITNIPYIKLKLMNNDASILANRISSPSSSRRIHFRLRNRWTNWRDLWGCKFLSSIQLFTSLRINFNTTVLLSAFQSWIFSQGFLTPARRFLQRGNFSPQRFHTEKKLLGNFFFLASLTHIYSSFCSLWFSSIPTQKLFHTTSHK